MKSFLQLEGLDATTMVFDVLDAFREYVDVKSDGNHHTIRLRYGQAGIEVLQDRIAVTATADDDIRLSYVKLAVAEHIAAHPLCDRLAIEWQGVASAATTPPFFQTIEVVSSAFVTPHMKRIRFKGASFRSYANGGLHVRLLFPPVGRCPVWPSVNADGRIVWPEGDDAIAARIYTIRSIDVENDEIEIDFVLHEAGSAAAPGADFGQRAHPGETIGIFAPGGDEIPRTASMLLLGDETALPAMARIIADLPAASRARVFAKVGGPADHYDFPTAANVELTYLYRGSEEVGAASLPRVLEEAVGSSQGLAPFIWAGCEFNDYIALRKYARETLQLPRDRYSIVAYWRDRRDIDRPLQAS